MVPRRASARWLMRSPAFTSQSPLRVRFDVVPWDSSSLRAGPAAAASSSSMVGADGETERLGGVGGARSVVVLGLGFGLEISQINSTA